MNTWFRRTVGTVGIAGGMLLLGAGAAHADDTALAPGQLDDLFSPAGGPNNQSLQMQAHGDRIDTTTAASAGEADGHSASASLHTNRLNGRRVPGALAGLPLSSVLPTESLGLPRTTSSRLSNLPVAEDSLAALPLIGPLTNLSQLGLPGGLPGGDTLQGTSITDTSTAFPSAVKPSPRRTRTEGLPLVGGLPLLSNGLPVHGTLNPVDDYGIPIGSSFGDDTEGGSLPLVGDVPLGGSDVLTNDSVTGVPVIGGVGPTPGVSTTAVANRLVPTTGALPQAASRLPLLTESAYAPRHASSSYAPRHASSSQEALPLVSSLPAVGGIAGGVLPMFSGIVG